MNLPSNFDKYLHVITFYRKRGHDCLNLEEIIRLIYRLKWYQFQEKRDNTLYYGGRYSDSVVIDLDTHVLTPYENEWLSKVSDQAIEQYLLKFLRLPLTKIDLSDKLTISNTFNSSQILISKSLFKDYCGYQNLMIEDLDQFTIDIEFDQVTADYFVRFLHNHNFHKSEDNHKADLELMNDAVHFNQFTNLLDYLDVDF